MDYPNKLIVGLITLFLSFLLISPANSDMSSQRIYSQRVQSGDALVVANNFIEAWRRNDFYETWQLLTPDTKSKFFRNIAMTYSFKGVLNLKRDVSLLPGAMFWGPVELPQNERSDYEMDHGLQFDDVMYTGSKLNVLPFNFGPEYKLTLLDKNKLKTVVTVMTDGTPSTLQIKMLRNRKDINWRIDQIYWEGSDRNARPWGIVLSN